MSQARAAVVTGSSRGIGRAIAERLAADGFGVVVNYARNAAAAEEVVRQIEGRGGRAIPVQADVASEADRQKLVETTLTELGRVDLLINNAGITSPGRRDLLDLPEESWDAVFATNLKGPFFLAQQVARVMIGLLEQGVISRGTLINISSISAYAVSTNRADYCMAKAAMGMMTSLFADRLAEHPLRVYEVCPGIIASDMTAPVQAKYDRLIAEGLTPIRRWGTPEDVAKVVATLADDTFDFSTGNRFHVDGGFHIRRL
jgi:3-oxoacyl-[acyl-carrier protein] reductase